MTAEEARTTAEAAPSPEEAAVKKDMVRLNAAITLIATQGRKEMTFPALKEVLPGHTDRVIAALTAQGFRVTQTTLPNSKVQKDRPVLHIAW